MAFLHAKSIIMYPHLFRVDSFDGAWPELVEGCWPKDGGSKRRKRLRGSPALAVMKLLEPKNLGAICSHLPSSPSSRGDFGIRYICFLGSIGSIGAKA